MIGRRSPDDAQSFEDALRGVSPRDEQTAELVRMAEALCASAVAAPTPEFRSSLRSQLMAEAATTLVRMPPEPRTPASIRPRPRRVRRRIAAVTAAFVVVGGSVGLVASSASAVPGDMLYSVKRTVESVELQLHRDDASRGAFQLSRAVERLSEARTLNADGASTGLIADTLDDFSSSAADGSAKLLTEFNATGEEEPIRKINDFVATSTTDLSELSNALSEGAADSFAVATATVTDLASEALSLCGTCTRPEVTPLVKTVGDRASKARSKKPAPDQPAAVKPGSRPTSGPAKSPDPASTSSVPKPAPTPAPPTPAPAATTKAPSLTNITDPLLGGLLGNDDQVGLVPGLLGGLLGTKPKP